MYQVLTILLPNRIMFFDINDESSPFFVRIQSTVDIQLNKNFDSSEAMLIDPKISPTHLKHGYINRIDILDPKSGSILI